MRPSQPQVQLHLRGWIFWKILWEEKSYILQTTATPGKETNTVCCIHPVWSNKEVCLPNLLWFHFWKWIRLDSTRFLQLSQQKPLQCTASLQGLPSKPELFRLEQVSPVTADNDFNAEPFYALPSNLQIQHWWTCKKGLLKRQDNWFQHPVVAKKGFMRKNGIDQYQRLRLL